jgi:outer membrane protein assembly factor BamD (BamD/ComL family)
MIKKIFLNGLSVALMLMLPGCKKPYETYKTTYKTEGAQHYADKAVDPLEATKKNIKHMTLPEVRAARVYFEQKDEVELIEKTLTHIIKLSDNYQEKADCLYELATIQLSLGRLEKARELFEQLLREYPGASFKKEACYRQLVAHYWDCSDASHDQEMTEKTLQLVQSFNKEWDAGEYAESLQEIEDHCYKVLFDAELLRMDFYLTKYRVFQDQDSLRSAQMRLAYILEKLLEPQKKLSSQAKDALIEEYQAIKELDVEKKQEKYDLLMKVLTALEKDEN